jgi:hypothetical protein
LLSVANTLLADLARPYAATIADGSTFLPKGGHAFALAAHTMIRDADVAGRIEAQDVSSRTGERYAAHAAKVCAAVGSNAAIG